MRPIFLLLAIAGLAFCQRDSGTVTVTASSTTPAQYDSASVQVQLALPASSLLDDALAVIQGAGFTAQNLANVSGTVPSLQIVPPAIQPSLTWIFSRTVSASDVTATLTQLEQARQKLKQPGSTLTYFVSNAASPAPECVYPALIGQAQSQARKVAEAAGLRLASIVSISQGLQPVFAAIPVLGFSTSAVIYNQRTSLPASFLLGQVLTSLPAASTCSVTVQFQMQ